MTNNIACPCLLFYWLIKFKSTKVRKIKILVRNRNQTTHVGCVPFQRRFRLRTHFNFSNVRIRREVYLSLFNVFELNSYWFILNRSNFIHIYKS